MKKRFHSMIGANDMKKKIKNLDKKDLLCSFILAFSFFIFVLIVVRFKYYYGSTLDWESQHYAIPEFFRMLFYDTFDFLPDFAFNLGNGQNIYNFSYYGLLSPIILLSYLFPFIEMIDYIVLSSVIGVIVSSILFYYWLRRHNDGKYLPCFLASFVLLFATCLSFHSHRHVMFINYMPFMIMGLYGVDKKLSTGRGWLLSLSVFLMIMTSYYYSVGGIVALVIYGIYKWIEKNPKPTIKKFFFEGFKFLLPIFIGIACAAIIILPTLHVLLVGRGKTFNTITVKDLLLPGINIDYMLYNTYGIGLTVILIYAIANLLFKKRQNFFLGMVLALMMIFPLFNYILNATMYIDAKAFIPFLPLAVYAIYIFINDILQKKSDILKIFFIVVFVTIGVILKKELVPFFLLDVVFLSIFLFLYYKFDKTLLLIIPIILLPLSTSFATSLSDEYVKWEKSHEVRNDLKELLSAITEDDKGMYRISNAKTILRDVNNLYGNIDYNTSTLYSSTYNMNYNKFYYDVINNPIQNRNRVITSPTTNLLFLLFSGNKYLIDNQANYFGYELYKEINGSKIYKNDDVFPVAYARHDVLNKDDFEKLSYPDSSFALMNYIIAEEKSTSSFKTKLSTADVSFERLVDLKNVKITKEGNAYKIVADEGANAYYELPEEYQNKIVFLRFKMLDNASCSEDDTSITIDGAKNKLTCRSWKYHNQNFEFDYILSNKDRDKYIIEFTPGTYRISDVEAFVLDYDAIATAKDSLDEFHFDMDKTKGDYIVGNIDVTEDGYFVTSVPYDDGFDIKVDGQSIESENVNMGFLGCKITAGHHEIKIEYRAPLKKEAKILSCVGIVCFAISALLERKRTTL